LLELKELFREGVCFHIVCRLSPGSGKSFVFREENSSFQAGNGEELSILHVAEVGDVVAQNS